ncbi:unnamed protein product [Closterium sp. Naga37s-1]|nr:unnamed protein product [Closterium sp. Naga37s-1]
MREENKRRISELQSQLAGETAAREEKEKEVSALAARLSQAEELLAYQKEEICKIREANSPAQSGTNTVGQDEGRVSSKEMKSLVSALVAQSAEAVKTLEQQKEETKKVWEAIFVTSKRGPTTSLIASVPPSDASLSATLCTSTGGARAIQKGSGMATTLDVSPCVGKERWPIHPRDAAAVISPAPATTATPFPSSALADAS